MSEIEQAIERNANLRLIGDEHTAYQQGRNDRVVLAREVKRLRAIVDALPMCWRLKDGELVQDVAVVPGMLIWVEYGGKIERDRAWQFYQHRFSGEPIQWFVLLRRGGVPIGDCYDSPEAAEHAAKAKGGK